MDNLAAIVLAGGRGSRMNVLCHERPKPLLPFASGLRVVDFTLNNSINSGVNYMAVLVDYQRQAMIDYLRRWARTNTRGVRFHISYPGTGNYLGTADAVFQNIDFIKSANIKDVLVLAGDHIYKMDYAPMLAFHRKTGADVTLSVVPVPLRDCSRFGIMNLDAQDRVIEFQEKPALPKSNLASMGIYIFKTGALIDRLAADSRESNSFHDFGRSIIPGMVKSGRVFAWKFDGYWRDIGACGSYQQANMDILRQFPPLRLESSWPILSDSGRGFPEKVWNSGNITRSLAAPGCVIRGKVINSMLGPGVVIDSNAVVRNSVIMANTFIGRNSMVENSVLDEEITVGENCRIGLSGAENHGEITVLGKRRIVQSGCCVPAVHIMMNQPAEPAAELALAY